MTANEVIVLGMCHVFGLSQEESDSEPWKFQALKVLQSKGLIDQEHSTEKLVYMWETTSKGAAHMRQLQNTPTPTRKEMWAGADGEEIK